jgi:hypothetical protein
VVTPAADDEDHFGFRAKPHPDPIPVLSRADLRVTTISGTVIFGETQRRKAVRPTTGCSVEALGNMTKTLANTTTMPF